MHSISLGKNLVSDRYLIKLFLWIVFWGVLLLTFIIIVDPYGVPPLQIRMFGFNNYKPKRIDIDRLIKPYEVWWYQPKTIFLGTSRIQQSIDPSVMNGTKFEPAYNASIPASFISQNAAYLEEYLKIDNKLEYVFIELFMYDFIYGQPNAPERNFVDLMQSTSSLFVSSDALLDALKTIRFNRSHKPIGPYISSGGFWIRPASFNTNDTFDQQLFVSNIMKIHKNIPYMLIQPSAMEALDRIVEQCRKHNVKLYLLITPCYPWDDYRLLSLGYWPLLEEWLRKLSQYSNVYSFSQYNNLIEEPAGAQMKWWNDPLHFSLNMGELMMKSLIGIPDPVMPANILRPVTPETVELVLHDRAAGLKDWSNKNNHFVSLFDETKKAVGNVERRAQ